MDFKVDDVVYATDQNTYLRCDPPLTAGTRGVVTHVTTNLAHVRFDGYYNDSPLACWEKEITYKSPEKPATPDDLRRVLDSLRSQGYDWDKFTLTHPAKQEEF